MNHETVLTLKDEMGIRKTKFDSYLEKFCLNRPSSAPHKMWQAMIYSLRIGGKRIRPILCMAGAELAGLNSESVMPMAMALEMVHTASLIHDDLPAMDDDTLRRGKPTNHVVYGEALAILAGDALLCEAFRYPLTELNGAIPAERINNALENFARALGTEGICGGQVLDMESEVEAGIPNIEKKVMDTARLKTSALIRTSVATGAILGGVNSSELKLIEKYGTHLGIAFQIADDLLDVIGSEEDMGKTLGKDEAQGKNTFVSVHGIEGARLKLKEETSLALSSISEFSDKGYFLRDLALYLEYRTN